MIASGAKGKEKEKLVAAGVSLPSTVGRALHLLALCKY